MKKTAPNSPERWLDLLPGSPLRQANSVAGALVMTGTRDRFPELPGEYGRIFLPLDEEWERRQRWYLQCFSRQLRLGGRLCLCPAPACTPSPSSKPTRIRQRIARFCRRLAARASVMPLARILVATSLRTTAAGHGLGLDTRQSWDRALPPSICFRKHGTSPAEEPPISPERLAATFQRHFGGWCDASGEPPSIIGAKLVDAESLIGGKPNATVLVLSPHPDDELIGCGGTLLLLAEAGARIHVVQMTEGATCQALREATEAERRSIRWEEARAVADSLGLHAHFWPTGPDYALTDDAVTRQRLRELLQDLQPSLIFTPAATDLHPEHRLACRLLWEAAEAVPPTATILEYPVWGFLPAASHAVDVTHSHSRVLQALYRYRTAMKAEDYVTRCRTLASRHAEGLLGKPERGLELFQLQRPSACT